MDVVRRSSRYLFSILSQVSYKRHSGPALVAEPLWVYIGKLSAILAEVGVAHVAGFVECVVEGKRCGERMGCLTALAHLEVVEQQRTIVGVSAVVDDLVGALYGIEVTQIGDALGSDNDVDRVLGVVGMGHHRHYIGDKAAFSNRGAREDGDVGVAGEGARAADTVHHLGTEHVGGVYATEYIGLESGIHGYNAESA